MNRTVIDERIHAAIRPQLDKCDRLLDHYTEGLPREVWGPIVFKVSTDHYGTPPFNPIVGSFADVIDRLDEDVRRLAQSIRHDAFYQDPHRSGNDHH